MAKAKSSTFETVLAEYRSKYNVDTLDSPNDVANLHAMIRNQMLIEKLQAQLDSLTEVDVIDSTQVKKMLDSIVALSDTNMNLERTLGIDRKTRKQESSESVVDYLTTLKQRAKEFLDNETKLTKVYCPNCKIMVGRISGVYDTTAYDASFQCPQCKKSIVVKRTEKDIFFDIKDAEWRRKYPIDIEQPKRTKAPTLLVEDELTIGDATEYITEDTDNAT